MEYERLSNALIERLNLCCEEIRASGGCGDSCEAIGWCAHAWEFCRACTRLGSAVANKTHVAQVQAALILISFKTMEDYPCGKPRAYLADLESLAHDLGELKDWVVITWNDGKPSRLPIERDLESVELMRFDVSSTDDLAPACLERHGECLRAVIRHLRLAVPPGSLGMPCGGFLDGEGRPR